MRQTPFLALIVALTLMSAAACKNGEPVIVALTEGEPNNAVNNDSATNNSNNAVNNEIVTNNGNNEVNNEVNNGPSASPTVRLTRPAVGDYVDGVVEVVADAEDDEDGLRVEFMVDEAPFEVVEAPPFAVFWDTEAVAEGVHVLRAMATDADGQRAEDAIEVNIDRTPPEVTLVAPAPGELVDAEVRFDAEIVEAGELLSVTFSVIDAELEEVLTEGPFEGALDVSALPAGEYVLLAEALDAAELLGADRRSFIVDRPPSVAFVSPEPDADVSGPIQVRVDARDDVELVSVELFEGDQRVAQFDDEGLALWSPRADGPVTLRALATDSRGQTSEATLSLLVDRAFDLVLEFCRERVCNPITLGLTLFGRETLRASSEDATLTSVQYVVDGENFGDPVTRAPFARTFNTRLVGDGTFILCARATSDDDQRAEACEQVVINNCDRDGDGVRAASDYCRGLDCDDEDPNTFPGAADSVGDEVDQNCDGLDGVDADQDDFASVDSGGRDCDDADPRIFPCPGDPRGVCADRTSDSRNCGGCGVVCDSPTFCAESECVCDGQICEEGDPEDYDFSVPGTWFNTVELITDPNQGEDLDEDGTPDNAFGPLMSNLGQILGVDVNAQLDFLIDRGILVLGAAWPTLAGEGPVNDADEVIVDIFELADVDGDFRTRDAYEVGRDNFAPGLQTPRARFANGVIDGGDLAVGPTDGFVLVIPFGDLPLPLDIQNARLTGSVSRDELGMALGEGRMSGVITLASMVDSINNYLQSDFCSCLSMDEPLIDLAQGTGARACVGEFTPRDCEQRDQALCEALATNCALFMLILPSQLDIDTNGDGRADAFSAYLGFEGQGTDIQGVAP